MSFCPECGYDTCKCNIFASPLRHPSLPELRKFAAAHHLPTLRRTLLPFGQINLSYDLRVATVKLKATRPFWPQHLVLTHSQAEHVRVHDLLIGNKSFMPMDDQGFISGEFFSSMIPSNARMVFDMPKVNLSEEVVLRVSGTNFRTFALQAAMQVAFEDDR